MYSRRKVRTRGRLLGAVYLKSSKLFTRFPLSMPFHHRSRWKRYSAVRSALNW
ncbi:hypothetical protein D3C80_2039540 [compost metagenome]